MAQARFQSNLESTQAWVDANGSQWSGVEAKNIARMQMQNPLPTGVDVAKYTSTIMRRDMAAYDANPSNYTQSLGCWHGFIAQQKMIAIKKHFGCTDKRYLYLSGWMVAAMRNKFGPLPDQSMHEKTAVPELVEELYTFLRQADARELDLLFAKLDAAGGDKAATAAVQMEIDSFQTHIVPVIADIDAGFGNEEATYLFAKKMIMAGAGCLQLENQVSDAKQCGHQGGKVTVPHDVFLSKIRACRHAFLELGVTDGVIVARTDSLGAQLTQNFAVSKTVGDLGSLYNSFLAGAEITNPNDIVDSDVLIKQGGKLIKPNRLASGLFEFRVGTGVDRVVLDCITSLQNGADLLWIETDTPNVQAIAEMVNRVRQVVPNAKLVYNNSPSFNWTLNFRQQVFDAMQAEGKNVSSYNRTTLMGAEYDETELGQIADEKIRSFQREASQHAGIFHHLITLPTYHTAAQSTDSLARDYFGEEAMLGYVKKVQRVEIREGIACVKHQNMAGSDMGDRHKEFFSGDSALKAGTKENTMNQFEDPSAGKIPYVDKPGPAIAPMAVRSKL